MATGAAGFEPPRLLFAPTPKHGGGRGGRGGRGPQRPRRPNPRMASQPARGGPHAHQRPFGVVLARAVLIAIAAILLLLGPLLSSAMAADLIRVGNAGAAAFSFVDLYDQGALP